MLENACCTYASTPSRQETLYIRCGEGIFSKNCINKNEELLVSYTKPHKAVTRDTVLRWIKMMMNISGVNTDIFGSQC